MSSRQRPELSSTAHLHYTGEGAKSYARSSRVQLVQRQMTVRALEMLRLPPGRKCLLLDIGCGNCLSGEMLQYKGHDWIGMDISRDMLAEAKEKERERAGMLMGGDDDDDEDEEGGDVDEDEEEVQLGYVNPEREANKFHNPLDDMPFKANVVESDMGAGVPFRAGVFDGAVSISAIQWLLVASSRDQVPERRMKRFFMTLQSCLAPGARAAMQFYPQNAEQIDKLTTAATHCGFNGGVVVDFPHSSRARKYYLVIYSGHPGANYVPPQPLTAGDDYSEDVLGQEDDDGDDDDGDNQSQMDPAAAQFYGRPRQQDQEKVRVYGGGGGGKARGKGMKYRRVDDGARPEKGSREWVLMKKAQRRARGEKTSGDSKYTMRRRKPRF